MDLPQLDKVSSILDLCTKSSTITNKNMKHDMYLLDGFPFIYIFKKNDGHGQSEGCLME